MSLAGNIDSHPKENLFSPLKQKAVEKSPSEQNRQLQIQQSATTGIAWTAQAAASQPMVGQQISADPKLSQKPSRQYDIKAPGAEDIAILSTSVSIKDESVTAVLQKGISNFLRQGFNMGAMEESYRETFKKSKSHNLLLERFMANVKFSVLQGLFSMLGVPAEEQEEIQREVRGKALAEIDSRLKNEWAYSKAMLEIVG